MSKDISQAIYWYERCLGLGGGKYYPFLTDLAWIYYDKKEYKKAFSYFQKAIENKDDSDGFNGIAYLYEYGLGVNKNHIEAMKNIDKAIHFSINKIPYLDSKGEFLLHEGNIAGALDIWYQCLSLDKEFDKQESKFVKQMKKLLASIKDIEPSISSELNINTFVTVVGNEKYPNAVDVSFANNDANIVSLYCNRILGIPAKNIKEYVNASYGDMLEAVAEIKSISDAYDGEASFIFYYAGHGIPSEKDNSSYLLPADADGRFIEVCYPIAKLYSELSSLKAKKVIAFIDACFSGAQRGEGMITSSRGVAIKAKQDAPTGNLIVFSAAQGDETAYPYKEKNHGLFTYYLLDKLKNSKGDATLGELADHITQQVRRTSIVENRKSQTPNVNSSAALGESWKNWTLK